MNARMCVRWLAAGVGVAAGVYGATVVVTNYRYGRPRLPSPEEADDLLDRFMPTYEVVERHHVRVVAPAALTLAVAREIDLFQAPVVRAIIRIRELLLGAVPETRMSPQGLVAAVQSIGWVILDESPGREVVVGAVTKPWEPNVTFRSIPAPEFASFCEPDYVKIAWTLRSDPISPTISVFRTETRAIATDLSARRHFRRYWSFLMPGIFLIRRVMLVHLKAEAERRAHPRARSRPAESLT